MSIRLQQKDANGCDMWPRYVFVTDSASKILYLSATLTPHNTQLFGMH